MTVSRVIGYLRVSTRDQDYGIEVQRSAIQIEAERRGWEVEWIVDQGETGKNANRPGLSDALARLERGEAGALIVSKLDRLSRSVVDFGNILRRATRPRGKKVKPWGLVALDVGIDMTTATGRLVAHILIAVAEWEGDTISDRTKQALAVAKRDRGVVPGAASNVPRSVVTRIKRARTRGLTFQTIADNLNRDGVPSSRGGRWHASTVQHAYYRGDATKRTA
ncbi:recombinase family protein [Microbacterium arborescens]